MSQFVSHRMHQSLVSAIIPCYNQAQYVAQAVRSVLDQTYQPVEVIVVDDGSPDDVAAALAPFADDPRVRLIRQANQGVSAARNTGITAARGTYLQFVDADDWLHLEKLARQVPILEADPEIGFVYCNFYTVDDDGTVRAEWSQSNTLGPLEPDIFNTFWLLNWCPYYAGVLIRREWVERAGGFNVNREVSDDYEYWMRVSATGCQVRYLPERLAYYRQVPGSRSRSNPAPRRLAARMEIARRFPEKVVVAHKYAVERWQKEWQEAHNWALEQEKALDWHAAHTAELERQLAGMRAWAEQQREAITWHAEHAAGLEQQLAEVRTWAEAQQQAIEQQQGTIARLQAHIAELEEGQRPPVAHAADYAAADPDDGEPVAVASVAAPFRRVWVGLLSLVQRKRLSPRSS